MTRITTTLPLCKTIFQQAAAIQDEVTNESGRRYTPEELEVMSRARRAKSAGEWLLKTCGKRYLKCFFDTYECKSNAQEKAVESLEDYAANALENVDNGRNIVLFGGKGGGKDHLAMSTARRCISNGATVVWRNGIEYLDELRNIELDRPVSRRYMLGDDVDENDCDILWLSDPLPPVGVLSDFQQRALFKVIDQRYRNMRPTWITVNVLNGDELAERIGVQTADRLRHDALAIHCNWPSYRTGK